MEGTVIKGRYRVKTKICSGSYGDIYNGEDIISGKLVALKLEDANTGRFTVRHEATILKVLQDCNCVPRLFLSGRVKEGNFLIIQLLGKSLHELRQYQPKSRFSVATSMRLAIQMLRAIELVHSFGFVHRDIKPANFVMGLNASKERCFIIDFGLSRSYLADDGQHAKERADAGFRGTARYASLNAHAYKDLSRRDDLMSWLYSVIELLVGSLPWKNLKDKLDIKSAKMQYDNKSLVRGLPEEFQTIFEYIKSLRFSDSPDYAKIENILYDIYVREGYPPEVPYDWDLTTVAQGESHLSYGLVKMRILEESSARSTEFDSISEENCSALSASSLSPKASSAPLDLSQTGSSSNAECLVVGFLLLLCAPFMNNGFLFYGLFGFYLNSTSSIFFPFFSL
eukprot:TRINITY_DN4835_c0_g1_i5.p1 TRINITY_DN4835_c0_g1~~TRINITY_DN4835_c0_g1_i5.p1  ORF type:complete len:397 (+),score=67.41 TRINITY_DN4835_c0_g1_i5:91-1281(+)